MYSSRRVIITNNNSQHQNNQSNFNTNNSNINNQMSQLKSSTFGGNSNGNTNFMQTNFNNQFNNNDNGMLGNFQSNQNQNFQSQFSTVVNNACNNSSLLGPGPDRSNLITSNSFNNNINKPLLPTPNNNINNNNSNFSQNNSIDLRSNNSPDLSSLTSNFLNTSSLLQQVGSSLLGNPSAFMNQSTGGGILNFHNNNNVANMNKQNHQRKEKNSPAKGKSQKQFPTNNNHNNKNWNQNKKKTSPNSNSSNNNQNNTNSNRTKVTQPTKTTDTSNKAKDDNYQKLKNCMEANRRNINQSNNKRSSNNDEDSKNPNLKRSHSSLLSSDSGLIENSIDFAYENASSSDIGSINNDENGTKKACTALDNDRIEMVEIGEENFEDTNELNEGEEQTIIQNVLEIKQEKDCTESQPKKLISKQTIHIVPVSGQLTSEEEKFDLKVFYCKVCQWVLNDEQAIKQHLYTILHRNNIAKLK